MSRGRAEGDGSLRQRNRVNVGEPGIGEDAEGDEEVRHLGACIVGNDSDDGPGSRGLFPKRGGCEAQTERDGNEPGEISHGRDAKICR